MQKYLKEKGISNNKFFLLTVDDDLLKVEDPTTAENPLLQNKIMIECKINFWYFVREFYRIPIGNSKIFFNLNEGNLGYFYLVLKCLNPLLIMPRQVGKTEAAVAMTAWLFSFSETHADMLVYGNKPSTSRSCLSKVRDKFDGLPPWLVISDTSRNPNVKGQHRKDVRNAETLVYRAMDNRLKIISPGVSEESAYDAGRGDTAQLIWGEEFAHVKFLKTLLSASGPAFAGIVSLIVKTGSNAIYSRFCTTTPGIISTQEGLFSYGLYRKLVRYDSSFLDMSRKDIVNLIEPGTYGLILVEYHYQEIRNLPDDYYENQCEALGNNAVDIRREILLIWQSENEEHPLGPERIRKLSESSIKPLGTLNIAIDNNRGNQFSGCLIRYYRKFSKFDYEKQYIASIDSSANIGKDYSVFVMTDVMNGETVLTFRTNKASLTHFALVATRIMRNFKRCVLIIESQISGMAIADRILEADHDGSIASRLYSYERELARKKDPMNVRDKRFNVGVTLTNKLREKLFNVVLVEAVDEFGHLIHDNDIITEISTLELNRRGKIEAKNNFHDDMVIAYLYNMWFLLEAPGKTHYLKNPEQILIHEEDEEEIKKGFIKQKELERHSSFTSNPDIVRSSNTMNTMDRFNDYFSKRLGGQTHTDKTEYKNPLKTAFEKKRGSNIDKDSEMPQSAKDKIKEEDNNFEEMKKEDRYKNYVNRRDYIKKMLRR